MHELHLRLTDSIYDLVSTEATAAGMSINRFASEAITVRAALTYTQRTDPREIRCLMDLYAAAADTLDQLKGGGVSDVG